VTREPITDETLMAYADSELDPATMAAIGAAVAADPLLARRAAAFAATRKLARQALSAPLATNETASMEDRVRAMLSASGDAGRKSTIVPIKLPGRQARIPAAAPWRLPLAASIALLFGLGGGYLAGRPMQNSAPGLVFAGLDPKAVGGALATLPSGQTMAVNNAGELKAIASFRDKDGMLCREFEFDSELGSALVSVACRNGDVWQIRFAMETARSSGGYAPASSLQALEAYLESTGAGAPLGVDEESSALGAGR
jgi:hypothetical protein